MSHLDKVSRYEYALSCSCSSSGFPCIGVRLVYSSLRCTATFVIRFHWSLLLAFSLHLYQLFILIFKKTVTLHYLYFCYLLSSFIVLVVYMTSNFFLNNYLN